MTGPARPAHRAVRQTDLPLPRVARGKVRDVYAVGEDRLLIVATDRISAFDVVLPQPIPDKGRVLTALTAWWVTQLPAAPPHHVVSVDPEEIREAVPELEGGHGEAAPVEPWAHRATLARRARPVPIECVVRGFISGSAWKEYRRTGTLAGEAMAGGLLECQALAEPIFSPATKAESGHDENITYAAVADRVGMEVAERLRERSISLYLEARSLAEEAGILIADTKFEFGFLPNGELILIDEVLTPDSSRFWPLDGYSPGRAQPSFDKQPVRDYLEELVGRGAWNREPPPPDLPREVVSATSDRYREAFRRLTGFEVEDFRTPDSHLEPTGRS